MNLGRSLLLASCALGAVGVGATALAQEQQPADRGGALGEIVVTAEKRAQSIQDVPASVSAFTSERRDELGLVSPAQQIAFTPGANYDGGRITIRGIGVDPLGVLYLGGDPGVTVYQDGFYLSDPNYIAGTTLTQARTEVLRGPQGTLYGRNSMGGAINTISRRPDDEWDVEARAGMVLNFGGTSAEFRVSGPITDAVRFSTRVRATQQTEGYNENRLGPDAGGINDNQELDNQIEIDITPNLEFWGRHLMLRQQNQGGPVTIRTSTDPFAERAASLAADFFPLGNYRQFELPGYGNVGPRTFDIGGVPGTLDLVDYDLLITNLTWQGDAMDIKYVAGYVDYHFKTETINADLDIEYPFLSAASVLQCATADAFICGLLSLGTADNTLVRVNPAASPTETFTLHNDRQTAGDGYLNAWSQELNFTSNGNGPLQWLFGLYYYQEESQRTSETFSRDENNLAGLGQSFADLATPYMTSESLQHLQGTSAAIFGQLDYDFSDTLHGTVGLRYTRDVREGVEGLFSFRWVPYLDAITSLPSNYFASNCFTTVCNDNGTPTNYFDDTMTTRSVEDSWNATTGTLGLQWTPDEDTLVYGRYSRGFKAGGFSLGLGVASIGFDDESVDAFEVGLKKTWDRFTFNSALYYNRYNNQQSFVVERRPDNSIALYTTNIKESEQYGLEIESSLMATDDLILTASYGYTHTEVTDTGGAFLDSTDPFAIAPGAQPVGPPGPFGIRSQTFDGNTLPQTPEHKVSLNALYTWRFEDSSTVSLSTTYTYRDSFYNGMYNVPHYYVDDAQWVDLNLVYRPSGDHFTLIAGVRNAFDEDIETGVSPGAVTGLPYASQSQSVLLAAPRIVSMEMQFRF